MDPQMTKNTTTRAAHLITCALVALLASSCGADDPTKPAADTGDTLGSDVPTDTVIPSGEVLYELPASEGETADCFNDCGNTKVPITVDHRRFAAYQGVIDGDCHNYSTGLGGDIDIIAVVAPVGTGLEIIVEPAPGSSMDPVITTHDGTRDMTYNDARALGERSARTVLRAPFVNPLPVYIIIEEALNYEAGYTNGCSSSVGGDSYGYIVTINEFRLAPVDLGTLAPGQSSTASASLTKGGDIVYFDFTASATASPSVTISRTGSASFVPTAVGLKTLGGDLSWTTMLWDEDGDGTVVLESSAFRACESGCAGAQATFSFAVLDWEGAAWPGEFSFDATVTVP